MSGYVPKVGDKVQATMGKNVLVGDVIAEYAADLIEIMVSDDESVTIKRGAWRFQQLVSVPTKFGAVIRRADGVIFVLAEPNSCDDTDWFGASCGWHRRSEATRDGFTVLFEGVDE